MPYLPAVADSKQAEPTILTTHSVDLVATRADVDKVKFSSNPLQAASAHQLRVAGSGYDPHRRNC